MIPVAKPDLTGREAAYVADAMAAGWITRGNFVGLFEESFANFCGVEEALATNTGTAALHVALLALGIGPGDEVIVPALSYIATANAVTYCGATPVFADVDPETWTIDPFDVEAKMTRRTKAIIAVHLFGVPARVDGLRRFEVPIVEDAAQAHGAELHGQRVGSLGDIGGFSFYANKIVSTGEGGMVTTRDPVLADCARLYAHQGQLGTYEHPVVGYNYRMTDLAAAIGCAQMERVTDFLAERDRLGALYAERLGNRSQLHPSVGKRVYWQYPILHPHPTATASRLESLGIETRPMFRPLHQQANYSGSAPIAESISARGLILPLWVGMTEAQVDLISDAI